MGNVVCSSESNDELIDALRLLGYIKTKKVERVFRAVDRGDYVLSSHRDSAYKDLSWKAGNIHLSAPCIYSKVMEGLSLEPGLSFLNLGSGTGYLSTMAGLILNHHGTNHGIELNKDCFDYANERLEEFKQKSLALDEFDFCEPVFIHGSCLNLEQNRQYDRVYCGAACPEISEQFIKQFLKIGGILVMPYKDHLLRIERVDKDTWKHKALLPVAFASLIVPKAEDQISLQQLPHCQPLSLQDLSRCIIRNELRKCVWSEYPELETKDPITSGANKSSQPQRSYPHYVVPLYENYARPDSNNSALDDGNDDEDNDEDDDDDDDDDGYDQSGRTHLLLYVDAHPDEDVTTLQVVRAMGPPATTNDNTPVTTTTTNCLSRQPEYFEVIDSDIDEDSVDSIEPQTTSDPQSSSSSTTIIKNRKSIYSPIEDSDDDDDDNEDDDNLNETPKKSRMINENGYLKFDDDSARIANEYFKTTSHKIDDTSSSIEETTGKLQGDRSSENLDKIEFDNSINYSSETLTDSNEKCTINMELSYDNNIAGQSNSLRKKNKKKLYSINSSFNDSEDEHDDNEKYNNCDNNTADKSNIDDKCRNINSLKNNTWNDSDDEGSCPLMDWSTSAIKPQTKWGIPERLCNTETSACPSDFEANHSTSRSPQVFAHNVDINAFSYHMKNKISQLPLPMTLQLYINYNRVL